MNNDYVSIDSQVNQPETPHASYITKTFLAGGIALIVATTGCRTFSDRHFMSRTYYNKPTVEFHTTYIHPPSRGKYVEIYPRARVFVRHPYRSYHKSFSRPPFIRHPPYKYKPQKPIYVKPQYNSRNHPTNKKVVKKQGNKIPPNYSQKKYPPRPIKRH